MTKCLRLANFKAYFVSAVSWFYYIRPATQPAEQRARATAEEYVPSTKWNLWAASLLTLALLLHHPEPHALAWPKVTVVGAPHLVLQDDLVAPQQRGDS